MKKNNDLNTKIENDYSDIIDSAEKDLKEYSILHKEVHHHYSIGILIVFLLFSLFVLFQYLSEIKKKEIQERKVIEYYKNLEKEKARIAIQKKNEEIVINSLKEDSSIQKFVNPDVSFNDKRYIPSNLVSFKDNYIIDSKGYSILREEAMNALVKMNKDFYNKFNKNITVVSAYRSYAYQKGIKDRGCPDNLCSKAGHSEHQSGLAVDLWETTTEEEFLSKPILKMYFKWLTDNAHTFGFHNTYQKGLEIDGYEIEPWHWRYVGIELASSLKADNITLAEYYNKKVK